MTDKVFDFHGMTLRQAAFSMGKSEYHARTWLNNNGYRIPDGRVRRMANPAVARAQEMAAIEARRLPFNEPCFRCGAARSCGHR